MSAKSLMLLSAVLCSLTGFATNDKPNPSNNQNPFANSSPQLSIKHSDIEKFATVLAQIQYFYIKPVPYKTLFSHAIAGMLGKLDPHSAYLPPADLDKLTATTKGEFAGIGVSIIQENGLIRVITPLDDSPAKKAGILPNDMIFKVNDKLISEIGINNAVDDIKGKVGTLVKISVYRSDTKKILNFNIKRAKIKLKTVSEKTINGNLGYLRISSFGEKTPSELFQAIKNLVTSKSSVNGMIIDLRNNPGGLLTSAIKVSDLFLDSRRYKNPIIVSTKGRINDFNTVANATPGDILKNLPIVVLINHGSASASEIVAAALGNHHRALLIGTRTFGKGSVQTVLPASEDSAIKLTTALYYSPNGKTIQARGVKPDIIVTQLKLKTIDDAMDMNDIITEASLSNHIEGEKSEPKSKAGDLNSEELNKIAYKDFQLYQAAKILETLVQARKL